MTRMQFEAEVARLTEAEQRNPKVYRRAVAGLVAFGYLALLGIVGGALALVLALGLLVVRSPSTGTVKLAALVGLPALVLAVQAVRSTFVRFGRPPGLTVTPREAPRLFEVVESIRQELRAPPIHAIVLTPEMNAAMMQRPRLGYFGWYENILILGYPLLRTFEPDEVASVIAHELGHATGAHGRFAAWIYRVRATWVTLADTVHGHRGLDFVARFLSRYMPGFLARTFVLARAQEYEADAASVRVVGQATAARALLRLNAADPAAGYFEAVWRSANALVMPPKGVISGFAERLAEPARPERQARSLNAAWYRDTDATDTHPALRERLRAMGLPVEERPSPPPPIVESAAERWLGAFARDVARKLDTDWQATALESWPALRREAQAMVEKRRQLEGRTNPSPDERFELARIVNTLDGPEAAAPLFLALAAEGHHGGRWHAGLHLLAQGDEAGLALLVPLCDAAPEAIEPVSEAVATFLFGAARPAEARAWVHRGLNASDEEAAAVAERSAVPEPARLRPHGRPENEMRELARALEAAGIERADFARVECRHRPDLPFYLAVVEPVVTFWSTDDRDTQRNEAVNRLADAVRFPGQTMVVIRRKHARLAARAEALEGCRILG